MTPVNAPLTVRRNAPFREEWTFYDEDGLVFDFTGWTAELQFRLYGAQSGAALVSLATVTTDVQGVRVLTDTPGTVRVMIDQTSNDGLPGKPGDTVVPAEPGEVVTFVYDLVMIDPSGFRQVFREGTVNAQPGVSV